MPIILDDKTAQEIREYLRETGQFRFGGSIVLPERVQRMIAALTPQPIIPHGDDDNTKSGVHLWAEYMYENPDDDPGDLPYEWEDDAS